MNIQLCAIMQKIDLCTNAHCWTSYYLKIHLHVRCRDFKFLRVTCFPERYGTNLYDLILASSEHPITILIPLHTKHSVLVTMAEKTRNLEEVISEDYDIEWQNKLC